MDWHLGPELLDRYTDGDLDLARQAAVETHLLACADCRDLTSAKAPQALLNDIWQGVQIATARPRPLRLLQKLGLAETDAIILRSSSSLYRPWLISIVGAFVIGVGGTMMPAVEQRTFYLLIAPLLPAITVAAAYDATDPVRELVAAAPFSKLRIALLRTALAVAVALPLVLLAGVVLPFVGAEAFAWLLPSLTLTLLALTLLTWWTAPVTGWVIAGLWLTVIGILRSADQLGSVDTPFAQLAFAVAALLALAALAIRLTSHHAPGGYA